MEYIRQTMVVREKPVDLTHEDYVDDEGFFMRSGAGDICYLPAKNADDEVITKTVKATTIFYDPVLVRKIFKNGTTASDIYAGYGL